MNKKVIIVSKCVKEVVNDTIHPKTYEFHFKGVLNSVVLTKLHLTHVRTLEVGAEYLMYAEITSIKGTTLLGTIKKIKPLDECITKE